MEVQARAEALRGDVAAHKAAIRRHRAALVRAAIALADLERECSSRGIRLVLSADEGEGSESPWPNQSSASTR